MTLQKITFIGTYPYTDQDFRDTAHAFERQFGPLDWTEERRLRDGQKAFYDIRAGAVAYQKDYLEPLNVNIRNQTGIRGFPKVHEAPV